MKKLDQNQGKAEKLYKSKLANHPLLLTCQNTFKHYYADMQQFDFKSEDLFVETARVLDDILSNPQDTPNYIPELWDDLKIKLKTTYIPPPLQSDLDTVCGVLFCILSAVFSLHYSEYYNNMAGKLVEFASEKGLFSDEKECKTLISNICKNAEDLDLWINQYDESNEWLSDEIDAITTNIQPHVVKKNKGTFQPTRKTFSKSLRITDLQLDIICMRLVQAGWLDGDCRPSDFTKLFSGISSDFKLKWLGRWGELHDLFDMLTRIPEGSKTGYITPRKSYLEILRSHFVDKHGNLPPRLDNQRHIADSEMVINDCEFWINHSIEQCSETMKEILEKQSNYLENNDNTFRPFGAKTERLTIKNRLT